MDRFHRVLLWGLYVAAGVSSAAILARLAALLSGY